MKKRLLFAAGITAAAFLAVPHRAEAWSVCVERYNSSGCLYSVQCDYYDDGGNPTGHISISYQC
jgi:hypothetical protein